MVRYKAACTLAEMTAGAGKTRSGMEDKDAVIAGTILPSGPAGEPASGAV